jgi:hypothetical protein
MKLKTCQEKSFWKIAVSAVRSAASPNGSTASLSHKGCGTKAIVPGQAREAATIGLLDYCLVVTLRICTKVFGRFALMRSLGDGFPSGVEISDLNVTSYAVRS